MADVVEVTLVKTYTFRTWVDTDALAESMDLEPGELAINDITDAAQEQVNDWMYEGSDEHVVKVCAVYTDNVEVN